ncbi:MAG: glyoxylate reductase [Kosmotogales bacterium]|nr:glyoxylate reductase [Kosmotogales bacterium]
MERKTIFFTFKIPEEAEFILKDHHLIVNEEDRFLTKEEIIAGAKNADALVCLLSDKIDSEIIDSLPNLKVIANYAVGYNNIDLSAAKEKNIYVTNTPDALTDATADITIGLLLAVSRRIVEGDKFVRKGKFEGWKPQLLVGRSIKDKTLGIIGLGRIGKAVAKRAQAFGMNVIYFNRMPLDKETEKKLNVEYSSLEKLLKESDVISLHCPLNKGSEHLLNERRLKMLKKNCILINTARGAIIEEDALIRLLKTGAIFGAGFDVYENEPEVPEELKKLENVVLLPHLGSANDETRKQMSFMVGRNIKIALEGKKPPNNVY